MAGRLHVAHVKRVVVDPHLVAGIIDVILAGDVVSGRLEQIRDAAADYCSAGMPDVQRTGRVYADEFDLNRLALAYINGAEVGAGSAYGDNL